MKTDVYYYTTTDGKSPFVKFLNSLQKPAAAKVIRLIAQINQYGMLSILPHTKKLTGTPLWEIRILGKDNIRVLYVTRQEHAIIVLHGFVKKTQETPSNELNIAMKRLQEVQKIVV
ncbi:type II toxin-antitoxin system RelE/ParE family toxin [Candidatus Gottesmanbacteria bacterium]|nr:type II toxin-antitoxin system RelE/ParE family toxin [Candidatus Gottesmanbacteria bacterium]